MARPWWPNIVAGWVYWLGLEVLVVEAETVGMLVLGHAASDETRE